MMDASPTARTARLSRLWQRLVLPTTPTTSGAPASSSVRATIVVAAIPSAASLVWTAWSLIDMIPAPLPVGLAAGVVLDVALVSAVAIAWIAPSVAKPAKVTGWLIASVAAVLVGWHAAQIMPVLGVLGFIPLFAKGLWHLALNARLARAAAETAQAEADQDEARERAKRDAELSTELTHEQRVTVAEKQRMAAHELELADAEVALADARAEREHRLKLAAIKRAAHEAREMEREDAETIKQRFTLAREIRAGQGFALGAAPDDISSLSAPGDTSVMGFGGAMGSDLGVSRGRPVGDPPVVDPQLRDLMTYLATAGSGASVRGAARELQVAPATIRRWRDKAAECGLDVSVLSRQAK